MANPKCTQCDNEALVTIGGHLLCVEHYLKFQQANQMQNSSYTSLMNFLIDQAEAAVGVYGAIPRIKEPQPIIHHGTLKFQNINVEKSNIGAINYGDIGKLDVMMNVINQKGNSELMKAIKEFTEAVIADKKIENEIKKELVEQITFLSSQVVLPNENRNPSVVKSVLKGIKDTLTGSAALATLLTSWDKLAALFDLAFSG